MMVAAGDGVGAYNSTRGRLIVEREGGGQSSMQAYF